MRPLRILTWHVHGSYLYYLTARSSHQFYLPTRPNDPSGGYGGRGHSFAWGDNVHEVPADDVRRHEFDCILFQSADAYLYDQHQLLSPQQRALPRIYLEHDPPRAHPTDTRHPVDDPGMLLVHVTHYNELMWDNGHTPTQVIDHGVLVPEGVRYTGEIERGIVVVNNLRRRGRRLGADVFDRAREEIALDLVGMGATVAGGIGEIPPAELAAFTSHYRFFLHPIRYTSLGLAVCEAMMVGMPVVALRTAEMATVIEHGVNGYASTDVKQLIEAMRLLLRDAHHARTLGDAARAYAQERFGIERFTRDWDETFARVTSTPVRHATNGLLVGGARR